MNYVSKPEPDIFLHAAKMLGENPANCLIVEDAPAGVAAAKRAGMSCVALSTTHGREHLLDADQIVDSFSEINLSNF